MNVAKLKAWLIAADKLRHTRGASVLFRNPLLQDAASTKDTDVVHEQVQETYLLYVMSRCEKGSYQHMRP